MEHCTGIAKVMGSNPVRNFRFQFFKLCTTVMINISPWSIVSFVIRPTEQFARCLSCVKRGPLEELISFNFSRTPPVDTKLLISNDWQNMKCSSHLFFRRFLSVGSFNNAETSVIHVTARFLIFFPVLRDKSHSK